MFDGYRSLIFYARKIIFIKYQVSSPVLRSNKNQSERVILMYHHIDREAGFNTVAQQAFEEQLSFLKKNFRVLSLDDYLQALHEKAKGPIVAITFDDGYTSFANIVLPVLQAHHIPATAYVPAHFIGGTNAWETGKKTLRIMSENEIREILKDPLVTLGAHGTSHRRLSSLDPAEIKKEMVSSKQLLEDRFAQPVHHFSFPYGQKKDYNAYAIRAVKEAGFRSAVSTNYSRINDASNIHSLNRIEIEPQDTLDMFRKKCTTTFHPKYFKQGIKNILYSARIL